MRYQYQRLLGPLPLLLALACGGGGSDGGPADVPVIVLSQSAMSMTEGRPETLTVVLDAAPSANVSVALASAGRVSLLPTSLDFTPANFATPKSVIVTPLQDIDLAVGTDTVTATAAGLVTIKVPVAIADNDSQAVVLDSSQMTLLEGDSATYGVKLAYQPLASVNVTLTPTDTMVVVTPTTLNFTPADYATPKLVKVRAKQDLNIHPDTLHIVATVPSGQFASLPVSITDDDQQAIQTDLNTVNATEGSTSQLGLRLAFQPGGDLTVNAASLNTGAATVSPSSRTFTITSWDTYQYVNVQGTEDPDLVTAVTTARLSGIGLTNKDVAVNVSDNDVQALVVSADTIYVTEGDTADLTITFAFSPPSNINMTLTIETLVANISSTLLTFTPANYSTGFTIQVLGAEDANAVTDQTLLVLTWPGPNTRTIVVIVADND